MSTVLSDVISKGTHAGRPAAGVNGRLYYETDTSLLFRDNGSTWDQVAVNTTGGSGSITASGYTQNTARLLGRTTASAGAIEEITVGSGLSLAAGSLTATGGGNYVQLADSLLGSDTASFDFTSISGSYKHLQLIISGRSTKAAVTSDTMNLKINNDGGANYDWLFFTEGTGTSYGTGSGGMVETFAGTSARIMDLPAANSTAGDSGNLQLTFPDYASTTLNKTAYSTGGVLFDRSAGLIRVHRCFVSWRNTAAITRITLTPAGGNWKTGSRATLYGLS
jgi:hypothetical protein